PWAACEDSRPRPGHRRRRKLLDERGDVRVRRAPTPEAAHLARAVVLKRVPCSVRDQHGVAGPDSARVAVDLHPAGALEDEVDLLGRAVVVALGRLVGLERRLGEALLGSVVELADRRAGLRREGLCLVY